jgi:hypothetical protein
MTYNGWLFNVKVINLDSWNASEMVLHLSQDSTVYKTFDDPFDCI